MFRSGRQQWRQLAKLAAVAGAGPSGATGNFAVRQFASEAGGAKGGRGFVSITLCFFPATILHRPVPHTRSPSQTGLANMQGKFLLVGGGIGALYAAGRAGYFGDVLGAPPQSSDVRAIPL